MAVGVDVGPLVGTADGCTVVGNDVGDAVGSAVGESPSDSNRPGSQTAKMALINSICSVQMPVAGSTER